jgi:hypothetical protein
MPTVPTPGKETGPVLQENEEEKRNEERKRERERFPADDRFEEVALVR